MKKLILMLLTSVIVASVLPGCSLGASKVNEYITFKPNMVYKYSGTGHEIANQTVYTDYLNKEKGLYQIRIQAPGASAIQCFSVSENEAAIYYSSGNPGYFYDMTERKTSTGSLVLKGPIKKGTAWEIGRKQVLTSDNKIENAAIESEITGVNMDIEVPYGKFKAIEITTKTEHTEELEISYYAKNIGLIKKVQRSRTEEVDPETNKLISEEYTDINMELESIEENVKYSNTKYFFYPTLQNGEIDYEERTLEYSTGEDIKTMFEKELKNYSYAGITALIGSDTKINSIDFKPGELKVKIDFSKEIVNDFSKDPNNEEAYMRSLVNTSAYFFDVSQVCITVDGGGYNGGIKFEPDQYQVIDAEINLD